MIVAKYSIYKKLLVNETFPSKKITIHLRNLTMNDKEKLNNIWAMTDKPMIEVMKKKSHEFSTARNNNSSSTSSESATDSDSDFSALPEEFRPNLNIEKSCLKKKGTNQISPTRTPGKNVTSAISSNKKALGNATSDTQTVNKKIESQKRYEKQIHPQKHFDINLNTSKKIDNIGKRDELADRSTTNTSLKKSKKKSLQYEYVQRQNMMQEPHLIQMKFDMRSTRDTFSTQEDGLKYETRMAETASVRFKKYPDVDDGIMKQKFHNGKKKGYNSKRVISTSGQTNNIKWDDSLSLKPEQNNKIKWNYVQIEKRISFETSADNSRKLVEEFVPRKNKFSNKSNCRKFNNLRPNEKRNGCDSKSSSTHCHTVKNVESRPKNKNSTDFFFKENNLHFVNESKIKYVYVSGQDLKEEELQDPERTYAKDYKNYLRKQNIEDILSRSSLNETTSLSRACLRKPTNHVLQSEHSSHIQDGKATDEPSQNIEEQRNCILYYGKEMSDLIIGSYTALSMLVSFYREWTVARRELLTIFKQLERNLQESSKTLSKYTDIIKVAKTGSDLASNLIPHPAVSMTAKIVSVITGLLQTLLKSKEDKVNIDDCDEVTRAMIKDTQTTSELHMYVLQCSQQFEETTKFIREFHSDSKVKQYFDNQNPEITTFIKGFLEYKPDHCIFYKKLHKCFCELLQTSSTSFSKSFCEPFTFYSSATEVIEYLGWHFRYEDFDSTSVNYELEAISCLIQSGNNTTIEDLRKRVRNCIAILTEELDFRERCMKDISLFDTSTFSK